MVAGRAGTYSQHGRYVIHLFAFPFFFHKLMTRLTSFFSPLFSPFSTLHYSTIYSHALLSVVYANLIIKGKNYGIHGFMVQLRDKITHHLRVGIECGDIGPKVGYNSMDNGYVYTAFSLSPFSSLLCVITCLLSTILTNILSFFSNTHHHKYILNHFSRQLCALQSCQSQTRRHAGEICLHQ
mgnify:CR=1 FL=1